MRAIRRGHITNEAVGEGEEGDEYEEGRGIFGGNMKFTGFIYSLLFLGM